MGKKVKIGKNRKDDYYYMAKSSGLRARSSFKLIEINKLYHILEKATVLIDLCAAPGGWMQVASRTMKPSSIIIGVDLVPIKPIPGTIGIVADITTDRCKQLIKQNVHNAKADVILHDGAPNVGANWNIDEFSQAHLCLKAFALATEFLVKNGTFVTKVFRSKDYESLKWVFEQLFEKVNVVKPKSSRAESAEIFLVCLKYKAPTFVDPKFLDIHHVFEDVQEEENKALSYERMFKNKRKAEGYEEGDSLYKVVKISDLLITKTPMNTVLTCNKIELDDETIRVHPLTTEVVKQYLTDLKLLGKYDFRLIEKWIKKMIPVYKKVHNIDQETVETVVAEPKTEEQQLDEDIDRCESELKRNEKKKLKAQRKEKMKQIKMIQMNMLHPGDVIEQVDDLDMFSASKNQGLIEQGIIETDVDVSTLDKILCPADDKRRSLAKKTTKSSAMFTKTSDKYYEKDVKMVDFVDPEDVDSGDEFEGSSEEEEIEIDVGESGDDEYENCDMEDEEDGSMEVEGESEDNDDEEIGSIEEEGESEDNDDEDGSIEVEGESEDNIDEEGESEDNDDEENGSIDEEGESEDNIDEESMEVDEDEESDSEEVPTKAKKAHITDLNFDPSAPTKMAKEKKRSSAWFNSSDFSKLMNDADNDESSDSEDEIIEDIVDVVKKGKNAPLIEAVKATPAAKPKSDDIDSNNPEHNAILNTLKRKLTPKERALAVEMIKSKKSRREILEWGYNRYQFEDEKLPAWLAKDEAMHMKPSIPFLSRDSVKKQKEAVSTDIGKRSIKKVEQAKARKKNRVMRKLHRLNKRAEKMDDDLTLVERNKKLKELNSKVSKLKSTKKPTVIEVTNKNGARNRVGKYKKNAKLKVVDKRMKSDSRTRGANSKKKGGRKSKVTAK